MANTRGGSVGNLRTMKAEDRKQAFLDAAAGGSWIAASITSPGAFTELYNSSKATLETYEEILKTGTTLLDSSATLAIAALNPISAVITKLIEEVEKQIDDFMGSGFYVLTINSQDDALKIYLGKQKAPNIKIERWKTGGLYVDPWTSTYQFSVQRLTNIDVLEESDPKQAKIYKNNPKKYLIWDGNVFDKSNQTPILEEEENMTDTLNVSMVNKINTWRAGMQSVPPSKVIEIINQSFDDVGDKKRPTFSQSSAVGGLVMIAGVTDPTIMAEKVAKLYNFFSTLDPVRKAVDAYQNIRDELDNFRKQRIHVRNLCAPNEGQTNPPLIDVPINLTGTKSNLKSDWDDYKIGTNSDNTHKYNLRNIDIEDHKNDKIFFKNLRSGQVFQIIDTSQATLVDTPVTTGESEKSTKSTDKQDSSVKKVNAIETLTQGTTQTYTQTWEALFDDFLPDTLPGDVLVEVELDDRYLFYDSESEQPEGGEKWYDYFNSFCLKNGTKITLENEDLERELRLIMERRIENSDIAYLKSKDQAWEYYSQQLDLGELSPYADSLKIRKRVSNEESLNIRQSAFEQQFLNDWENLYGEPPSDEVFNSIPEFSPDTTPEIMAARNLYALAVSRRENYSKEYSNFQINEMLDDTLSSLDSQIQVYDSNISTIQRSIDEVNYEIEVLEGEKRIAQGNLDLILGNTEYFSNSLRSRSIDLKEKVEEALGKITFYRKERDNLYDRLLVTETEKRETIIRTSQPTLTNEQIQAELDADASEIENEVEKNRSWQALDDKVDLWIALYEERKTSYDEAVNSYERRVTAGGVELIRVNAEILENAIVSIDKDIEKEQKKLNEDPGYQHELIRNKAEQNILKRKKETLELTFDNYETTLEELQDAELEAKNKLDNLIELQANSYRANPANRREVLREGVEILPDGVYRTAEGNIINPQTTLGDDWRSARQEMLYEYEVDAIAVGGIRRMNPLESFEPYGDDAYVDKLNWLISMDPENKIPSKVEVEDSYGGTRPSDLRKLTPEESLQLMAKIFKKNGLDPSLVDPSLLDLINNKLDGYYFLPRWDNKGGPLLDAPRFCIVQAVDDNLPEDYKVDINNPNLTPSRAPDWKKFTLEDIIPEFRQVLNLVTTLLKGLKSMTDGLIQLIEKIVKLIKDKVIVKLEKLLKQLQEWVELLNIGIVDAGIHFLYIPPVPGGISNFRKKLVSAQNVPSDNLHFTYSLVLLAGGLDAPTSFDVLNKIIKLS